jgi:hypothetical protein
MSSRSATWSSRAMAEGFRGLGLALFLIRERDLRHDASFSEESMVNPVQRDLANDLGTCSTGPGNDPQVFRRRAPGPAGASSRTTTGPWPAWRSRPPPKAGHVRRHAVLQGPGGPVGTGAGLNMHEEARRLDAFKEGETAGGWGAAHGPGRHDAKTADASVAGDAEGRARACGPVGSPFDLSAADAAGR